MKTERLYFRRASATDSNFIYELVNDADWLDYIGDRKVSSQQEAIRFINESLNAKQADNRLGLRICCLRESSFNQKDKKDTPIGLCGLLKRDYLDSLDIGYAIAKEYRGVGYAIESARFFTEYAINELKVSKLYATVLTGNRKSISLLKSLGYMKANWLQTPSEGFENTLLFQFQSS